MKRALLLLALSAIASLSAFGADVAGIWKCAKPEQTIELKEENGKLTGTLQGKLGKLRIAEGKLEGDKITLKFLVVLNNGVDPLGLAGYDSMAEEGQVTEITYTGSVTGADLKVKVTQERLDTVRELTFHKTT